jgi:hypothetical protein
MAMSDSRSLLPYAMLVAGLAAFVVGTAALSGRPHPFMRSEISVRLPVFAQVLSTAGDRYLAANFGAIRALITETAKMRPEEYPVLAGVQMDVSALNPAHEDNYYTAAAILPWSGELDAAQEVLRRASEARPFDYQPGFYYAFNLLHFKRDAVAASAWLRKAAEPLTDQDEKLTMQNFAAQWIERANDPMLSVRVVEAMAMQSKTPAFKSYLIARAGRLRSLIELRTAADMYAERQGRRPDRVEQLVSSGLLPSLPTDPFGFGFKIDSAGEVQLLNEAPR